MKTLSRSPAEAAEAWQAGPEQAGAGRASWTVEGGDRSPRESEIPARLEPCDPVRFAAVGFKAASVRRIAGTNNGLHCVGIFPCDSPPWRRLAEADPQVVLMRLGEAAEGGIEATAILNRHLADLPVLVVAKRDDYGTIAAAFRAGASGYLLDEASLEELRNAVRVVRNGGTPMSDRVARRVVEAFRPAQPDAASTLTRRERQVIELLIEGHANKEIAARLSLSIQTVRHHLKQIYLKFGVGTRTAAVTQYCNLTGSSPAPPRSSPEPAALSPLHPMSGAR